MRLDQGIREGLEITPYYHPNLGKPCAWGRTRPEAVRRMIRALEELRIVGVRTTVPFCMAVMNHPAFIRGDYCTGFISDYLPELSSWAEGQPDHLHEVAALGATLFAASRKPGSSERVADSRATEPAWVRLGRERQVSH